jgi:serine protease DegQ
MRFPWLLACLTLLVAPALACADDPPKAKDKDAGKIYQVPFRLIDSGHLMVRVKINGKGPFNFILDTGAPALFISKDVGKKIGLKPDKNNWVDLDRFEIEGGLVVDKAHGVVDTPFQLEGMNGLGLAGAEIHGIIGYNVLAHYRMEIDFSKDKMAWTKLDYTPMELKRIGGKGAPGGLEMMGSMMKTLGWMMGTKAAPEMAARGSLGLELAESKDALVVQSVLAGSPAAKAGVKPGDRLTKFQDRTVTKAEDVLRLARKLGRGDTVKLTFLREKETVELTFKTGEGL